jgi:hypothetical protein
MGLAKVRQVRELRKQGVPPKQIAEQLGVSVGSVHRIAPATKQKSD